METKAASLLRASIDMADGKHDPKTGEYHRLSYVCSSLDEAQELSRALSAVAEKMGYLRSGGLFRDADEIEYRFAAISRDFLGL